MSRKAGAEVRNTLTVESPFGLRSFNLLLGDITKSTDEVLVVPSHANVAAGAHGAVLSAIRRRYGVSFEYLEPLLAPRPGFGTYRVRDLGRYGGKEILVVRIPGADTVEAGGGDPAKVFADALWTLFGSLAALELRGNHLTSLALPLLAGTRGYAVEDLMRAILNHSIAWLKSSRLMVAVNFYVLDSVLIDAWAGAMDAVLGRQFVDSAHNRLARALRDEILAQLTSGATRRLPASWAPVFERLRASLGERRIPVDRVAADGRAFAECVVTGLLKKQGVQNPKGQFAQQIQELKNKNLTAPWMLAHFNCLREFGNAGVHPLHDAPFQPPKLHEDDLVAILASLQRVLAFVQPVE